VATRARFGRLPRSAPSLTATIVALAQQYEAQRETNLLSAWNDGGLFEGKKVTDEMVLAYLKEKRDGLSHDDPMWDHYDQQLSQYTFAIENSKMELKYQQNKIGEGAMVAFYKKWAGKVPRNSEAWRDRMKLAAGYADRARSAAAGRASASRVTEFENSWNNAAKKGVAFDVITAFVNAEAHNQGIISGNEQLGDLNPMEGDGAAVNTLWDRIATAPEYADERADMAKQIEKQTGKPFTGGFGKDAWVGYQQDKIDGLKAQKKAARKAGYSSYEDEADKGIEQVRAAKNIVGGYDEQEEYEFGRAQWEEVILDPNSTPHQIDAANKKWLAKLGQLEQRLAAQLKTGEFDDNLGLIRQEIKTMKGDETPTTHWKHKFGGGGTASGGNDASDTAMSMKANDQKLKLLGEKNSDGSPKYALTKTRALDDPTPWNPTPGNFKSLPWGVVAVGSLPDASSYVPMPSIPGDPKSAPVLVGIVPTPVKVTSKVYNASTGETAIAERPTEDIWFITTPSGTTGIKYKDSAGEWRFTPDIGALTGGEAPDGTGPGAKGRITMTTGGVTLEVPAVNGAVPLTGSLWEPSYHDNGLNGAMTSRVAKSAYGLDLIGGEAKNKAGGNIYVPTTSAQKSAYNMSGSAILTALRAELGDDPKVLGAAIIDSDAKRATVLGNTTEEQQRYRVGAILGNPVPVAALRGEVEKAGGKSVEQATLDRLTSGGTDQITEDLREGNRAYLENRKVTWTRNTTTPSDALKPRSSQVRDYMPDLLQPGALAGYFGGQLKKVSDKPNDGVGFAISGPTSASAPKGGFIPFGLRLLNANGVLPPVTPPKAATPPPPKEPPKKEPPKQEPPKVSTTGTNLFGSKNYTGTRQVAGGRREVWKNGVLVSVTDPRGRTMF
jgi:hypothetical protein